MRKRVASPTWLLWLAAAQAAAILALAVLPQEAAASPSPAAMATVARSVPQAARAAALPPAAVDFARAPSADVSTPASPSAARSDSTLGTILYGCVVDEDGKAVPQGHAVFRVDDASPVLASISIDERRSSYAISGVTAATVVYRAHGTGFQQTKGTIAIPAGAQQHRHDIVLPRCWLLAVRFATPGGEPLRSALRAAAKERQGLFFVQVGAVVTAARPAGDFPLTALREAGFGLGRWRSANGIVRIQGKPLPEDVAGIVEIDVKQPVWVSAVLRHRVLASVPVEVGQDEVALTVAVDDVLQQLGTIRGRVVDAVTGAPVQSAHVEFGDQQSGGFRGALDGDGRFAIGDLRPGLLTVGIWAEQRQALADLVELRPGQVLDLGDVPVFAMRTVDGRCEGAAGKPDGWRVSTIALDPPPHPAMRRSDGSCEIAKDGSFRLSLAPLRYRLRVTGAGGAVVDVDARTLPEGPLVLRLQPEAPLRLDVRTNGETWELALFDAQNREVYRRDLRDGWKFALHFLPGDYRAELRDPQGKLHTRTITIGEAGADLRVP
jgi:hypothetical protein